MFRVILRGDGQTSAAVYSHWNPHLSSQGHNCDTGVMGETLTGLKCCWSTWNDESGDVSNRFLKYIFLLFLNSLKRDDRQDQRVSMLTVPDTPNFLISPTVANQGTSELGKFVLISGEVFFFLLPGPGRGF